MGGGGGAQYGDGAVVVGEAAEAGLQFEEIVGLRAQEIFDFARIERCGGVAEVGEDGGEGGGGDAFFGAYRSDDREQRLFADTVVIDVAAGEAAANVAN